MSAREDEKGTSEFCYILAVWLACRVQCGMAGPLPRSARDEWG